MSKTNPDQAPPARQKQKAKPVTQGSIRKAIEADQNRRQHGWLYRRCRCPIAGSGALRCRFQRSVARPCRIFLRGMRWIKRLRGRHSANAQLSAAKSQGRVCAGGAIFRLRPGSIPLGSTFLCSQHRQSNSIERMRDQRPAGRAEICCGRFRYTQTHISARRGFPDWRWGRRTGHESLQHRTECLVVSKNIGSLGSRGRSGRLASDWRHELRSEHFTDNPSAELCRRRGHVRCRAKLSTYQTRQLSSYSRPRTC